MKKQIVLMVFALVPVFLLAQNSPLTALFEKYASKPGFESSEIIPGSMSFEWEKTIKIDAVKEMLKEIQGVRILKYKSSPANREEEKIWKKFNKTVGDEPYQEVVKVNADSVMASLYIVRGTDGITKELALIAKDKKGITMVTVNGNIDFAKLFSKENLESLHEMASYFMHHKEMCHSNE